MSAEARLEIHLRVLSGRVAVVDVASSRRVAAAAAFAGRTADAVSRLLPAVFSLCGTAQGLACRLAVEGSDTLSPARRRALLAETVAEHGTAIARDWPALNGEAPDLAAAKALRAAGRDPAAAARALIVLLGAAPDSILGDAARVLAWAQERDTATARLFAHLVDTGLADFGTAVFAPMPAGGPPDLARRLAEDGESYLARPDCAGVVFETGPLARRHAHPLVAALMGQWGNGLVPRLAARLVEVAAALADMLSMETTDDPPPPAHATGTGVGVVEAARGLLAHHVELAEGLVTRYRILAPTEWNFHPAGPLVRGLTGAVAGPDIERRARLLVAALDPCVACEVTCTR
ncbi:MAG: nickel-dependent hydrogenase large subunit [Magnetospirillum sp.]|nr:nickel-dependent hydrogenase large subunit [Magnetospirillum sp.]